MNWAPSSLGGLQKIHLSMSTFVMMTSPSPVVYPVHVRHEDGEVSVDVHRDPAGQAVVVRDVQNTLVTECQDLYNYINTSLITSEYISGGGGGDTASLVLMMGMMFRAISSLRYRSIVQYPIRRRGQD